MNKEQVQLAWTVTKEDEGRLLRDFLLERQQISRRTLAKIKHQDGRIVVNEQEKTVRAILYEGDKVRIILPSETPSANLSPENKNLDICYEDEHLLIINKDIQMLTIPSKEHPTGTLANAVLGYYEQKGIAATFHAVNRLDKDTSGLLVVAKHRLAHDKLSKLQQDKRLKRYYEAIVEGCVTPRQGVIDAPIARKLDSIIERMVHPAGQRARTHYEVIAQSEQYSYVRIELETGRTHQIRVHFSSRGYPLCGDDLYGGHLNFIPRQALHCYKLELVHPFTNEQLLIKAEMPKDMWQLKQNLGLS
ncbi:RNA pseudouridine synthase [Alkalihalobacillus alcalophilus ATCC 27647 = CGMCC 1.3604]|uniref:Pseudouridine synthase n=1 Tax=Alkalihalobacillus alcalophilus ATCC 27647 = CGMCC 1.3604 TaxID=1218173 RepID=A0A094XEY4_ALKAL|nr:RluA family pseudouridine synthase [Alkalihalobacillus alcalophilus]KGA97315.1 pseudouridine synthase [Alkalihalobacillus alcalophilus ATCC 27647 = CGMCC 1.3604]MED1562506.1 RluA family pseudouridine synthase [Alkalihalobacillus alcalophilus]THG92155.1 RNA pseudouridine synthase [Alkalihalobacillus alcalophilus ATCC 27647 = CGMCC 1.3604]